jgi:hypothetical protein
MTNSSARYSAQVADHRDFAEKASTRPGAPLDIGGHPDVGQGAVDQVTQADQLRPSRPAVDGDGSRFNVWNARGPCWEVANFVGQLAGTFDLLR